MLLELIGFLAGALTTFCWLPQAIKILRTRETRDIALSTQIAFTAGCSLWAIYGFLIGSPSIVLFNVVTTGLALMITVLKLRYG